MSLWTSLLGGLCVGIYVGTSPAADSRLRVAGRACVLAAGVLLLVEGTR